MESPVTVKLHESLKDVEDRTCLVLDDDGPFLYGPAQSRHFISDFIPLVASTRSLTKNTPTMITNNRNWAQALFVLLV